MVSQTCDLEYRLAGCQCAETQADTSGGDRPETKRDHNKNRKCGEADHPSIPATTTFESEIVRKLLLCLFIYIHLFDIGSKYQDNGSWD